MFPPGCLDHHASERDTVPVFPNVSTLVKIELLILINTADCERVFSIQPDQDKSEGKNESEFSELIDDNFSECPSSVSTHFMYFYVI